MVAFFSHGGDFFLLIMAIFFVGGLKRIYMVLGMYGEMCFAVMRNLINEIR